MPAIKGVWKWNKTIPYDESLWSISSVYNRRFMASGEHYDTILFESSPTKTEIIYTSVSGAWAMVANGDKNQLTKSDKYRLIDFGTDEKELSEAFYTFLVANAEYIPQTVAEKLTQIAENEQKVYDAGYAKGKSEGGGDSYYDTFWNHYQQNGNRTYYDNAFTDSGNQGGRWLYGVTYKPKYQVKPTSAMSAYAYSKLPYEAIAEIDFSNCKEFYACFNYYSGGNRMPPIDIRKATRTQNLFGNSSMIETIDEILVSEASVLQYMFNGTTGLKEVRFNGTIGQNHLDFKSCTKLSKESIENVISHLSDSTSGLTVTFSKAAVDKAFESSEGANDGSETSTWLDDKLSYRPNWTITLV